MAGLSTQLARFIQRPIIRKISGLMIIILGIMALWMPINSLIKMDKSHKIHNKIQISQLIKTPYINNNFANSTYFNYPI
jgi:hypothetical protein